MTYANDPSKSLKPSWPNNLDWWSHVTFGEVLAATKFSDNWVIGGKEGLVSKNHICHLSMYHRILTQGSIKKTNWDRSSDSFIYYIAERFKTQAQCWINSELKRALSKFPKSSVQQSRKWGSIVLIQALWFTEDTAFAEFKRKTLN